MKNWRTERSSCKLNYQQAGLYLILEKVGNLYKVDLFSSIWVHLVFSTNKLQKAANDPLLGQKSDPPLPIEVDSDNEWEIEEILASKLVGKTLKYRAHWKGYNPDPNWYSA